jgi:hypothetical protein
LEKNRLIFFLIFEKKSPDQLLILNEKILISKIWIWQPCKELKRVRLPWKGTHLGITGVPLNTKKRTPMVLV